MDYQVELSRSARSDLEDIVRYISIDDPDQAERFGRFLLYHIRSLSQFPERGRIVPEFDDESIREIIVRDYRLPRHVLLCAQKHKIRQKMRSQKCDLKRYQKGLEIYFG